MPHKHKRKRDDDASNFDLAPNTRAKPLAAFNKASIFTNDDESSSSNKRPKLDKSKTKKSRDDTPKAFARLMAWQAIGKKPSGLDNGTTAKPSKKKRKQPEIPQPVESAGGQSTNSTSESIPATTPAPSISTATTKPDTLKILPGETLSNFALRVDQTLPLNSIFRQTTNPNTLPTDLQAKLKKSQRTTKHNKRLQRMQADWRATEAKLREKEADEAEDQEDQREEQDLLWAGVRSARTARKGKKKSGKGGSSGNTNKDDDDDPWRELEKKRREETKQKNLQDVVQAPPTLKQVKNKFKAREEDFDALDRRKPGGGDRDGEEENALVDVRDVPSAVGSLRRREELNVTRRAVIEGYRKMHGRRRGLNERLDLSRTVMT